jgi:HTH-type transcriptional regulator / antitoxin HigA
MEVNVQDIATHWVALHEAMGVAKPIVDEAHYLQLLNDVDVLVDQVADQDDHPLWGLIGLLGDRIRAYEDHAHPWPDTTTPASALAHLMEEHGLKQSDLAAEVGAQSVVSAILAGKRQLNLRQVKALARRFHVPIELFI